MRGMTDAQKRRIIDAYLGTPLYELSEELGLTPDAIRRFALRQGLRKGERFEERRQAKEKCRACQLFCNGIGKLFDRSRIFRDISGKLFDRSRIFRDCWRKLGDGIRIFSGGIRFFS